MYKELEADLHIHTVSSGHAYSTIGEIVAEAKNKGLKTVAITDHGPAMPGGAHPYYFSNLRVMPEWWDGIRVLKGVEANITDAEGTLDLDEDLLNRLDLVLVAFHIRCGYEDLGVEQNTETLLRCLERYNVQVIAHPGNTTFELDHDKVAKVAKERGILVEFNNGSYVKDSSRHGAYDLDYELALACKKYGTNVILTSDAHLASDIGNSQKAWDLVSKADLSEKQILSLDSERILRYLEGQTELA